MFKKLTAIAVCLTHMCLGLASTEAWAAAADSQSAVEKSAEFTLLENVIALQGQQLSDRELQSQLSAALTQYEAVAQKENRSERLSQALVALGVYTPSQAAQFMSDIQAAASRSADFSTILGQTLSKAPQGAQFSWCALGGGVLVGVSAFVTLIGLVAFSFTQGGDQTRSDIIIGVGAAGFAGAIALIVAGARGDC